MTAQLITSIAGAVAILTAVVAVTRSIVASQLKGRLDRLDAERKRLADSLADSEAQKHDLADSLDATRRGGVQAVDLKLKIDDALRAIMRDMQAGAGSVYIASAH